MTVPLQDLYDQINDHARAILPELLREWFPLGRMISKTEYGVANLNGDKGESLSINIRTGKWKEFAGGPGGHEPLGLYAHAFCGGDRKLAFRELRAKFGLADDAAPVRAKRPVLKVVPKDDPEGDWKSMVPPPDDVGKPDIRKGVPVYTYLSPNRVPLRYTSRHERADKTKYFIPHTYGTSAEGTKWHDKHPNAPMCLYGLERLGGKPVLLQEGEQKSDDVQKLLAGWACLGWSGGGNRAKDHDYSLVTGQDVYVVGDAVDGIRGMMDAADCLHRLGVTVYTVDLGALGFPKGWDLGNATTGEMWKKGELVWKSETGKWPAGKIEAFIRENGKLYDPDPGNVDLGDDDAPDLGGDDPTGRDKRTLPPIPLGYDSGYYFYLSPMTGQIEPLARRSHTKHELVGIADLKYFESLDQFKTGKNGALDWLAIENFLKGACAAVGFYRPERTRGRGCWLDKHRETGEVRAVMNLGNRLIVDGETHPLRLPGSEYFYEAAPPLNVAIAAPATKEQAAELLEICKLFRWEKDIYGTLMAGWIVTAAICGALFWRPAIWVTGGSGSGKSTLEKLVVKRVLHGIGLFKMAGTTEAGLRAELGRDARPVTIDEAEAESPKARATQQGLLDLNRQSSSEGGAEITKGTQNQSGPKKYHVRSSFAFSSINPMLEHLADESRVTVLELRNPAGKDQAARDQFDALVDRIESTLTKDFSAALLARFVWMMPTILENAETFSRAVAVHLGSARVGDQIGTMLAGAFALISDKAVSAEAARKWVEEQSWDDTTSADAVTDEMRLLNHLMQQRATLDHSTRKEDLTLAEIVRAATGENGDAVAVLANNELRRHGLLYEAGGVWIANQHSALKKHLEGTPWAGGWERALKRLPGAKATGREAAPIRFRREDDKKGSVRQRATFVPIELIE